MRQDLTLCTYPTSYPSSSVGGWLAQGGAGLGSYEFGYFKETVVSARVVLPSGEVMVLHGDDLDLKYSVGYLVNVPTVFGITIRFSQGFLGETGFNFWFGFNW